jgi:hypothetical protein
VDATLLSVRLHVACAHHAGPPHIVVEADRPDDAAHHLAGVHANAHAQRMAQRLGARVGDLDHRESHAHHAACGDVLLARELLPLLVRLPRHGELARRLRGRSEAPAPCLLVSALAEGAAAHDVRISDGLELVDSVDLGRLVELLEELSQQAHHLPRPHDRRQLREPHQVCLEHCDLVIAVCTLGLAALHGDLADDGRRERGEEEALHVTPAGDLLLRLLRELFHQPMVGAMQHLRGVRDRSPERVDDGTADELSQHEALREAGGGRDARDGKQKEWDEQSETAHHHAHLAQRKRRHQQHESRQLHQGQLGDLQGHAAAGDEEGGCPRGVRSDHEQDQQK